MSSTTSPVTVIGHGNAEQTKSAVIIGAGPVGLAASLMLEKCGYTDITIVEKRPRDSFESSKAYLYLIDLRGQRVTDLIGQLYLNCQCPLISKYASICLHHS